MSSTGHRTGRLLSALAAWSLLFAVVSVLAIADPAAAAVITVTTNADSEAIDGECSLREALFAADQDVQVAGAVPGECPAGIGADTIVLQASGPYVVTNTQNDPLWEVGSAITIIGNDQTIDAAGSGRIFTIASAGNLTIESVTLTGGDTNFGGAINNFGTLTVSDSTIIDNNASVQGGAINNFGTATITDTSISDNTTAGDGAGIYNRETLTIVRSTVSGNDATQDGGGLYTRGTQFTSGSTTVTSSTVAGNTAVGDGGGVFVETGTMTALNSTFAENEAHIGGAIRNFVGTVSLDFVTVVDNTAAVEGGLSSAATVGVPSSSVSASIITGNTATTVTPGSGQDIGLGFASGGYNVVGEVAGDNFNALGDIVDEMDFRRFVLADNGGPTETVEVGLELRVLDGATRFSLAINRVPAGYAEVITDQRGVARPAGFKDAGAFELESVCSTLTFSASTIIDFNTAIDCHNQTPFGAMAIDLAADLPPDIDTPVSAIDNASAEASLTINGNGFTLDASGSQHAIDIINGDVTIDRLRVTGSFWAGIDNQGSLVLTESTLDGNGTTTPAPGNPATGGGLRNSGDALIENSTIVGNGALSGGGIFNTGTLTVVNSTIADNVSLALGAGVDNAFGGQAEFEFVTVTDNFSLQGQAAFDSFDASTELTGSIIAGNADADLAGPSGFTSLGGNVIGTGAVDAFDQPGDITEVTDPGLAPLAFNGGTTQTAALLPTSPAINRVTGPSGVVTDQRGEPRPAGAGDAGAFEAPESRVTVLPDPCNLYDSTEGGRPFDGGETRMFSAIGSCIPEGATAVTVTVTASNPVAPGNLRLGPSGVEVNGGVVNYTTNDLGNTNTVTVPLNPDGLLDVTANGGATGFGLPSADVRITALAFGSPTSTLEYHPITPCAVADSRENRGPSPAFTGPFTSTSYTIDIVGDFPAAQGGGNTNCGIPASASAVVVNVVSTNGSGGFGSIAIDDLSPGDEAVVNYGDLGTNNAATATVGLNGETIAIATTGEPGASTNVRVVALGYYDDLAGDVFTSVAACAAFDTRPNQDGAGDFVGTRVGGQTTTYQISGAVPAEQGGNGGDCGVPAGATSVLINLVALNPVAEGNLQASATGTTPTGGVLNYGALSPVMTNANAVAIPLDSDGQLDLTVNGGAPGLGLASTDVRGVVLGYWT